MQQIKELEDISVKLKIRLGDKIIDSDYVFNNDQRIPGYSEIVCNQFHPSKNTDYNSSRTSPNNMK